MKRPRRAGRTCDSRPPAATRASESPAGDRLAWPVITQSIITQSVVVITPLAIGHQAIERLHGQAITPSPSSHHGQSGESHLLRQLLLAAVLGPILARRKLQAHVARCLVTQSGNQAIKQSSNQAHVARCLARHHRAIKQSSHLGASRVAWSRGVGGRTDARLARETPRGTHQLLPSREGVHPLPHVRRVARDALRRPQRCEGDWAA